MDNLPDRPHNATPHPNRRISLANFTRYARLKIVWFHRVAIRTGPYGVAAAAHSNTKSSTASCCAFTLSLSLLLCRILSLARQWGEGWWLFAECNMRVPELITRKIGFCRAARAAVWWRCCLFLKVYELDIELLSLLTYFIQEQCWAMRFVKCKVASRVV